MVEWQKIIRQRMSLLKMNQAELAHQLNITPGGVGHWFSGRRTVDVENIVDMMNILGIDSMTFKKDGSVVSNEFYTNKEHLGYFVKIVGEVNVSSDGIIQSISNLEGILSVASPDPTAEAIRIINDELYPRLNAGEFIVIEPRTKVQPGDEVLVRTNGNDVMIKKLESHRDGYYRFAGITQNITPLTVAESSVNSISYISEIVKSSRYKS